MVVPSRVSEISGTLLAPQKGKQILISARWAFPLWFGGLSAQRTAPRQQRTVTRSLGSKAKFDVSVWNLGLGDVSNFWVFFCFRTLVWETPYPRCTGIPKNEASKKKDSLA